MVSCKRQHYPICPLGIEGGEYANIILYLSMSLLNTRLY